MSTKRAIIASACVIVGAILFGILAMALFMDTKAPNADQRASLLGQGVGTISLIPFAIIWVMWAKQVRQERERRNRRR